MRMHSALAGVVAVSLAAGAARAQTPPTTADDRLNQFERRLADLERKHEADLKSRDEEIARLRAELEAQKQSRPAATPTQDEIDRTKQDVLNDLEGKPTSLPTGVTTRTPASFNPDFAVVSDFAANLSTNNDNKARNRFDVREVELDLRAAVDPRADAVAIIPVTRDVDDPLFFEKGAEQGGPDTGIELEEAYLFLHDFGVPNLTAKLGRFHLRFGRENILHAHDWPTTDNNFVNQSFLAPESLTDTGLSLSYVVPPDLIGGQYVELIGEFVTGEGDESPTLNNDSLVNSPAFNGHILWNHDIAPDWNFELGGTWLTGKHDNSGSQNVNLFGGDFTLIHTDPTGGSNNQLFQAEAIYGMTDISNTDTSHAFGAYLLAQQQLNKDWYAGVRLDWTENALNDKQEVWGVSPYVSWYWSEFLRFRMEYQHKGGDTPAEDNLYFQATWIFGAHPPHPYWAMR